MELVNKNQWLFMLWGDTPKEHHGSPSKNAMMGCSWVSTLSVHSLWLTDAKLDLPKLKFTQQPSIVSHKILLWQEISSSTSKSLIFHSESSGKSIKPSQFPPYSFTQSQQCLPSAAQSILFKRSTALNLSDRGPYMGTVWKVTGQWVF